MSNLRIGKERVASLLMAQEVQAVPGEAYRRSNYAVFTAELVLAGCGRLEVNATQYDVEEGDVYFLPPGQNHSYAADDARPWRKLFFNIGGVLAERLLDCYGLQVFHFPAWREPEIFWRMLALYENLDPEAHREAALLLHRLIALAAEEGAREVASSDAVALAVCFIENNLQNHIRLDDIARASYLSGSQLTRLFKAEMDCTPYDYLCSQRIEMAKHLLRCTDLRLGDIAGRLQFADPFYFSTAFKKRVGCSPRAYRHSAER